MLHGYLGKSPRRCVLSGLVQHWSWGSIPRDCALSDCLVLRYLWGSIPRRCVLASCLVSGLGSLSMWMSFASHLLWFVLVL